MRLFAPANNAHLYQHPPHTVPPAHTSRLVQENAALKAEVEELREPPRFPLCTCATIQFTRKHQRSGFQTAFLFNILSRCCQKGRERAVRAYQGGSGGRGWLGGLTMNFVCFGGKRYGLCLSRCYETGIQYSLSRCFSSHAVSTGARRKVRGVEC